MERTPCRGTIAARRSSTGAAFYGGTESVSKCRLVPEERSARTSMERRPERETSLLQQAQQALAEALQGATVRGGDEHGIVAGEGTGDLVPAHPVEGAGDGMGAAGERPDDEEEPGLAQLDRQVADQRAEALLAGRLRLADARRQGVGLHAVARLLDQAQLGDVTADRRLGR